MAYDEALAERVRAIIAVRSDVTERKMFGGIAWMVGGNMACGVMGDDLCVKLDIVVEQSFQFVRNVRTALLHSQEVSPSF